MKRGDIWVVSRLGHERRVLVVGDDGLTVRRDGVLTVPISDVMGPGLVEPAIADAEGMYLGVAQVPLVGQVSKAYFTKQAGELASGSVEIVDMALRAAPAL